MQIIKLSFNKSVNNSVDEFSELVNMLHHTDDTECFELYFDCKHMVEIDIVKIFVSYF